MARAGGRPRRRPLIRASRARDVVGGGEFRSGKVVRTGLIAGSTFGIKSVQYTVVDGLALFEGDIILGTEQAARDADRPSPGGPDRGRGGGRAAITGAQFRWPNCRSPLRHQEPACPTRAGSPTRSPTGRARHQLPVRPPHLRQRRPVPGLGHVSTVDRLLVLGRAPGRSTVREPGRQAARPATRFTRSVTSIGSLARAEPRGSRHLRHHPLGQDPDRDASTTSTSTSPTGTTLVPTTTARSCTIPATPSRSTAATRSRPVDPTAPIGQRMALSPGDIAAANSMCPKVRSRKPPRTSSPTRSRSRSKDIRLDTRKELILDTRKEASPRSGSRRWPSIRPG